MHEAPQRSQGLACLDACLHRVAYPACTGSGGLKKQRDEEFFHADVATAHRAPSTGKYGVRRGILFHPWPSGQVAVGMRGVFVQWRSNQIQTV